jgi:hypothetical protein
MTLTEAQIERYSRQILLPEVGGRGQERLLAVRILVAGDGAAAATAATLLGRAGVGALDVSETIGTLPEPSPDCRVERHPSLEQAPRADAVLDLTPDTVLAAVLGHGRQARRPFVLGGLPTGVDVIVYTLVGRPCVACLGPNRLETRRARRAEDLEAPAAMALGALAASEVLRVLLLSPSAGRTTLVSMRTGQTVATELPATHGCALCGDPT